MARKNADPTKPVIREPKARPVRLNLAPEYHHLLCGKAADANMSMTAYDRTGLLEVLKGTVK